MADDTSNILETAATATQGMIPGQAPKGNLTSFGPAPMVQPPPIPRFQPPQIQQPTPGGSYSSVGERKRADKKALFDGIAGMVKSGSDYLAANKQRELALDLGRLMEAQQGITEAKQVLQSADPNSPQAKEAQAALEKNTGIVNMLTKDPKKAKQFQKAMNIDLFGDGKNKTENQALMQAWTEFAKKQQAGDKTALNPTAQKIMDQQPQRLGMDPQSQAQAAAVKAGLLPSANARIKAYTDTMRMEQTAKTAEERNAAMAAHDKTLSDIAEGVAHGKDKAIAAYEERTAMQQMSYKDKNDLQLKIAQIKSSDNQKKIDMIGTIANSKSVNDRDRTILGSLNKQATTYNNTIKNLITENTKLQEDLEKKTKGPFGIPIGNANDADAKTMRNKIGMNNMAIKLAQKDAEEVNSKIDTLHKMGIITLSAPEGDGDGGDEGKEIPDDQVPE